MKDSNEKDIRIKCDFIFELLLPLCWDLPVS